MVDEELPCPAAVLEEAPHKKSPLIGVAPFGACSRCRILVEGYISTP